MTDQEFLEELVGALGLACDLLSQRIDQVAVDGDMDRSLESIADVYAEGVHRLYRLRRVELRAPEPAAWVVGRRDH